MQYPNYYINFDMPDNVPANIKAIVTDFLDSDTYDKMMTGEAYYNYKNTAIMERVFQYYSPVLDDAGEIVRAELLCDLYRANNTLASGYVPLLTDQLSQYLLGNPITYDKETDKRFKQSEYIDYKKFTSALFEAATECQYKIYGWVYFYIEDDKLKSKQIPTEQIVPIKDESGDNITHIIRAYIVRAVNDDGEMEDANIVEVYDSEKVSTYIKFDNKTEYEPYLCYGETYQKYHITTKEEVDGEVRSQTGTDLGVPPFAYVEYKKNGLTILDQAKTLIDIYDVVNSDFANNFEDFQEAINIVQGYNGTDLKTVNKRLKEYKTILTEQGNDFKRDVQEVPYQARKEFLQITNDNIFKFGQGVDPTKSDGSNLTNVVIKAKYSLLDLKASGFRHKVDDFFEQARQIINVWLQYKGQPTLDDITPIYDKEMIMNEVENLAANAGQTGIVSEETQLANNLYVTDVSKEMKRKEAERQKRIAEFDTGEVNQNNNEEETQ